jgi:hypothetical protein
MYFRFPFQNGYQLRISYMLFSHGTTDNIALIPSQPRKNYYLELNYQ